MRRMRGVAALAAGALLLSGCTLLPRPETTSTPVIDGVPADQQRFYGQRIVWERCAGEFRCATATAPLDWEDPGEGEPVELALTMLPAGGRKVGTMFVNPGGPGASGVDFLQSASSIFSDTLRDRFDIVSWDPRGVGASSAVDCYDTEELDAFLFGDPDLPEGSDRLREEYVEASTEFGQACLERTGELLAFVDTASTAHDLDMLRAALGEQKLDYFGFSYGTQLGAAYADAFPSTVGRMVLDGAVDPSLTDFEQSLSNVKAFGAAFRRYLEYCLDRSECPFRGQSIDEATDAVADLIVRLRESPLGTEDGREVNGAVLRTAIDAAAYDAGSWSYLTQAFTEVLNGRTETVQLLADSYVERGPDGYESNIFEAIFAVNCLDAPVETDPEVLERQGEQLSAADPLREASNAEDLGNQVCANWPVPPVGEPAPVRAVGSPPILVLGTTGDPATPYEWAVGLADQLPQGVLLTLEGDGHTAYRNGVDCINEPVDAFLVEGTVPEEGIRCS